MKWLNKLLGHEPIHYVPYDEDLAREAVSLSLRMEIHATQNREQAKDLKAFAKKLLNRAKEQEN